MDVNNEAAIDLFVAGEVIEVADQSISQIDESQVLVQPADAVCCEVVKEDGDENEGTQYNVFDCEISKNLTVQLSEKVCEDKLAISDSGSAVKEEVILANHKKFKLSENVDSGRSVPLENKHSSPELPHKLPAMSRQKANISDDESDEAMDGVHTNMFGVNFVMWFDISIEGKSAMDREEEDWGGKLEFGFSDKSFPKEIEDYFLLMEDDYSTQSHNCFGIVMGTRNLLPKIL